MSNTGTTYGHDQWIYYVKQREDNGRFTVYLSDGKDLESTVATIPDFPTFEEAQNALDGYALKHKFAECSTPSEETKMEQQTIDSMPDKNNDSVPPADDPPEMEQGNDTPESGNDGANSENEADGNPSSKNDSLNPDNENPPYDNDPADSENDSEKSDDTDEKSEPLPDGPTLSLRLPAFDSIFDTADASLRDLARAMKTKLIESGELAIKVVINNYGGVLKPDPKKCKVDCTPKPAKVSNTIHFPSDLEIAVEKDGRVIIPDDREHQINFDEIQPGEREIPPSGGTVTVDGQTGLAEHYEGNEEDKPDGDDNSPETPEEPPQDTLDSDSEDSDFEGDPNAQEDQPPYSDGESLGQGDNEE